MDVKQDECANFYQTSKFDVVVIIIVLFFSIAWILWIASNHLRKSSEYKEALIYQKGQLIKNVPLGENNIFPLLDAVYVHSLVFCPAYEDERRDCR